MAGLDDVAPSRWPAATVLDGGIPVACWFAVERLPDGKRYRAFALSRAAGGTSDHFALAPGEEASVADALREGRRPPGSGLRPTPCLGSFADGMLLLAEMARVASGDVSGMYSIAALPFGPRDDHGAYVAATRDAVEATRAFVEGLDRRAVAQVLGGGLRADVPDGCWWGIDATFGQGEPLSRALERWPYLSRPAVVAFALLREGFASARDGGASAIADAMAEGIDKPWVGRNLDVIHAAHAANVAGGGFRGDPHDLDRTLVATGLVPAGSRPGRGDMAAFLRCAPAVRNVSWVACPVDMGRHLRVGRDWVAFEGALARACGDVRPGTAVRNVEDMLMAFKREVLSPALHVAAMGGLPRLGDGPGRASAARDALARGSVKSTVAASALLSGRTLARALRDSARWHAGAHRIAAAVATLPGTLGKPPAWEAILPGHVEGELSVVVLTDAVSLANEGRTGGNADGTLGLDHCVGGYASRCLERGTRVLSLRRALPTGGFERLSTAEVEVRDGTVSVVQHSGSGNADPSPTPVGLLDRYLATLADMGPWDAEAIPRRPAGKSDPCSAAGYDWFVPGNLETVIEAWSPFMPRALRGMAPAGWAALEAWAERRGTPAWERKAFPVKTAA